MSKGLEALETLKFLVDNYGHFEFNFDIIEKELKDYEILKEYHNAVVSNREFDKEYFHKCIKALEIIKEHPEQLLDILETDNYNEYLDLDYAPDQYLNEEEYDLLKEVLE